MRCPADAYTQSCTQREGKQISANSKYYTSLIKTCHYSSAKLYSSRSNEGEYENLKSVDHEDKTKCGLVHQSVYDPIWQDDEMR
ncbi:hypothetical protein UPYG_G00220010 [Umbra pygmaea]|uniref:Uncharacterized protein n=1 Tax=Umbra pygmaea TaxID=75934 RepID=A0ABD0WGI7_UMBPY